ncbi:peptidoglycan-binding protein [Novosphingobium sp. M1R2S20]|uniref:Peptidoglycan-binding protein n=1 Tax=Novosphingobium rhizovicinum TaxID=3228928 RepID=A0ABV3R8R5_9SPHN
MIDRTQLSALTPSQRADLIYRQAQSELAQGLWRAALGDEHERNAQSANWSESVGGRSGLDALLALMSDMGSTPAAGKVQQLPESAHAPVEDAPTTSTVTVSDDTLRADALGPNVRHADSISRAAERTGIPATALASIIDAEAGRARDGSWNIHSRNPRSSAAGLGQFLSGTWEAEAERPGTWLNEEANRRGWLNDSGQVTRESRSSLLSLRYDPEASIQTIADYARGNLNRLKRVGVNVDRDVESVARAAYLGHHLGPSDAAKFLNGGLDPARARRLLAAQVGPAEASRRLMEAGNATDAHRRWLTSYTERRINPDRFA